MAKILPLNPADFRAALSEIRRLWEVGDFIILPHARKRMEERGLDELDVQNVIRTGRVTQQTLSRFKIVGKSVEDDTASCVVEMKPNLIIVTVMVIRRKSEGGKGA